jgi:hypothetical protein
MFPQDKLRQPSKLADCFERIKSTLLLPQTHFRVKLFCQHLGSLKAVSKKQAANNLFTCKTVFYTVMYSVGLKTKPNQINPN